ncbi:G/U mismatch-specific DNA glycosylase [Phycisphaerales bacterium AB-hyl4]|uniref:G/U mismatch-specific DNA glycosylase n=1 Tax=Natronomicrosphaera hydrolytica TaxID=3242702 RepID=A0ABV4U709_9BACT
MPTPDLQAARNKRLPDVIAPGLRVLLCGINPGLYSAAVGCHFARPGNRFWPTLHLAGITPRQFHPAEQFELLTHHVGLTNLAPRATARADELTPDELRRGAQALTAKLRKHRPALFAVLGVTAYRQAFNRPKATLGPQPDHTIAHTPVWVLPNPSGLNAHYQLNDLAALFKEMWQATPSPPRQNTH